MANNQSLNCSYIFSYDNYDTYVDENGTHGWIESNPDVGGTGVIISFAATAYVTLLLVLAYYASACLLHADPASCNRIDSFVLRRTKEMPLLRLLNKKMPCWEPRIRKAILMYSDQQLITGLALLTSAYMQLRTNITSYHWQLAVYLAWFSSLTHLCTLTVLRPVFRENSMIRTLRLVLMFVNVILLISALIPTGNSEWLRTEATGAIHARCYFKSYGTTDFSVTGRGLACLISVIILVFGSVSRAVRLSTGASQVARAWLIEKPSCLLREGMRICFSKIKSKKGRIGAYKATYCLLSILSLSSTCFFELYTSMLWEILWLVFALVWGSLRLFLSRDPSWWALMTGWWQEDDLPQYDDQWTFGQFIAIFLLTLPWLSLIQDFLTTEKTSNTNSAGDELETHVHAADDSDEEARKMIRMGNRSFLRSVQMAEADTIHVEEIEGSLAEDQILPITDFPQNSSIGMERQAYRKGKIKSAENTILFLGRDPYLYEWFRLSILMVLLFTCLISAFTIAYSNFSTVDVLVVITLFEDVAALVSCLLLWMLYFVVTDVALFSNQQAQPSASTNHTTRSSASWKRSALYMFYLVLLFGGMIGVSLHFWIVSVYDFWSL